MRLLIDVSGMVYRAHGVEEYAARENGGTVTLAATTARLYKMVVDLFDKLRPTHAVAVYDGGGVTWRHKIFPAYKAQRKPKPEGVALLIGASEAMFDALGVVRMRHEGVEADDLIASFVANNVGCTIYGVDKDYYQLRGRCQQFNPMKKVDELTKGDFVTDADIWKTFGTLDRIVDMQALIGDKTDGIPGCPGIGEKGASEILAECPTWDSIWSHPPRKFEAKLRAGYEIARVSRELVTLDETHPVGEVAPIGTQDETRLRELMTQWGWV